MRTCLAPILLICACVRLNAQQAAAPATPPADQTVALDPFEVKADSDTSYGALNSRSITSFNVALDHLPVSADIYDQAFMRDIGATGVEALIQNYSAGAGVNGLAVANASQNQPGDRVNLNYTQLRGTMTPNVQRDSLLFLGTLGGPGGTSVGYTSNFDLERVEVILGPEAMLYDGGGPGGVINLVTKEARLNSPTFGSLTFRTDEWGTKYGLFDYGTSAGNVAVRVALLDTSDATRRVNVGDHIDGQYVQLAAKLWNTVARFSVEQTKDNRVNGLYETLTSTAPDPTSSLNGYSLSYLLASGKAGSVDNGLLNWNNINSLAGDLTADDTVAEFATLTLDTHWTDWLTTQISGGISTFTDDHSMDTGAIALYAPGATSNPLPGNWTMGMTGAFSNSDGVRPYHGQGLRFSALLTNELLGGRAKSQTDFGADLVDNRGGIIQYAYYQADSSWNIITSPAVTTNLGRTVLPKLAWTVNQGAVLYPLFRAGAPRITYNGVNYVRAMQNPFNKALVSEPNPLGASIVNGSAGTRNDDINSGVFAVNHSEWMDSKLDTLIGVRLEHAYTYTARAQKSPANPTPIEIIDSHSFNFDVGADYHVLPWLAPYFSVSDSDLLAPDLQNDPYGQPLPVAQAIGEEAGLKLGDAHSGISGSLAVYHIRARNQELLMNANLETDINPSGLNGVYDSDSTSGYAVDVDSKGAQALLTANPTKNWRLRFSAAYTQGTIESNRVYNTLYNDQFNVNSAGAVTYADGTAVYVAPTFNSKTPSYTQATAPAGSVPLTVTLLSTPGGVYFGSPQAANGAIQPSSTAAKVLLSSDPQHGAIVTGANGLPLSAYQLNPALTGVPLAGQIPVALTGERTTGYPLYSANLTNVYTFDQGCAKGISVGGTAACSWKSASYYYYPNGLTTATGGPFSSRTLFSLPTATRLDLILSYAHKFGKLTFTSQLNVYNLLNHYDVIIYPDVVSGWTNAGNLNANFSQQPRSYVWTNRVDF